MELEFSPILKELGFNTNCNIRITKQSLLDDTASKAEVGTRFQGTLLQPINVGNPIWMEVRDAVTGRGSGTFNTSNVSNIESLEHGKALVTTQTSIYLLELV